MTDGLVGTPDNPDIIDYLRSEFDNVDGIPDSVELGGILGTIRGAATEIEVLRRVIAAIDEKLCCDGRDCGCRGSTKAEEAEHYIRKELQQNEKGEQFYPLPITR
jgi:hypothetical protein